MSESTQVWRELLGDAETGRHFAGALLHLQQVSHGAIEDGVALIESDIEHGPLLAMAGTDERQRLGHAEEYQAVLVAAGTLRRALSRLVDAIKG